MAEDLGRILIDFGKFGAGTTGPEPTRQTPDPTGARAKPSAIGTDIMKIANIALGASAAMASKVGDVINGAMAFVEDTVASIRESGRFAPGVAQENIAMQIQQMNQQLREASVLGPMYQMILRWYRELMRLLEPWKLLISTIMTTLTGAILKGLTALMTYLNSLLPVIIKSIINLTVVMREYAQALALVPDAVPDRIREMFPNFVEIGEMISGEKFGGGLTGVVVDIASGFDVLLDQMHKALNGIGQVVNNTAPKLSGNTWLGSQLREIAQQSPFYPKAPAPGQGPSWFHPAGSRYGQGRLVP